jgi:hypothetical protein
MEKNKKDKYEKPQLQVIELKADEVLAGACKTATGGGALPPNCQGGSCVGLGS